MNEPFEFDENEDFFPEYYDLEEIFDKNIHPLLTTIINICEEYNIPMLTTFQYANGENQVMLCTSVVLPPERACNKITSAAKNLLLET
jgi:hypothetical protein